MGGNYLLNDDIDEYQTRSRCIIFGASSAVTETRQEKSRKRVNAHFITHQANNPMHQFFITIPSNRFPGVSEASILPISQMIP